MKSISRVGLMASEGDKTSKYSLELIPAVRAALFHWSGPITLEDRQKNVQRMVRFCEAHGVRNLIIDGRDQLSATSTVDAFDFANEVPAKMKGLTIAVVHRPDDPSLQFIETVAKNRGALTKTFLSVDEAKTWLQSRHDTI